MRRALWLVALVAARDGEASVDAGRDAGPDPIDAGPPVIVRSDEREEVAIATRCGAPTSATSTYGVRTRPFERFHPIYCDAAGAPESCVSVCNGGGIGFLGDCVGPGDFASGALRTGIREEARIGANSFALGFVGGTDTHVSTAGLVEEEGGSPTSRS